MTSHPYQDLPERAFWKTAVSNRNAMQIADIYTPRFRIGKRDRIATAGSCFAQHIGRQFKSRGYNFVDTEPAPRLLASEDRASFGYELYSARYGNVYSARQLLQLYQRALGEFEPVDEYWEEGGRFFDPYRPNIEPDGFGSLEELRGAREAHLRAVRRIPSESDIFVFTFGLTESWINRQDGAAYPLCPGTARGTFDPTRHEFVNFNWPEVMFDFERVMELVRGINPEIKFLLTVSPVPLTATASGNHVLPATIASKSTLRSVCAELYDRDPNVDYFPSYELVSAHPMRAMYFDPNLRTVAGEGVSFVMEQFFSAHSAVGPAAPSPHDEGPENIYEDDDVVCDEQILEQYAR
jgi:hypothetical protein